MTVYFIQPEGEPVVKIGQSERVYSRLTELQVGHHRVLNLLGELDGGPELEFELHQQYAEYNIRGEWFRLEGCLQEFIATLPAPIAAIDRYYERLNYDPSHWLVVAWFSRGYPTDEAMAERWRMDAATLREALGPSGRPYS